VNQTPQRNRLDRRAGPEDHILGAADAAITLVEYGSYACPSCRAANERIAEVRDEIGRPLGLAAKPSAYTWRQLGGAGALAGIGFTMSLFIAGQSFPVASDFAAAKVAIFAASIPAACIGVALLWSAPPAEAQTAEENVEIAATSC